MRIFQFLVSNWQKNQTKQNSIVKERYWQSGSRCNSGNICSVMTLLNFGKQFVSVKLAVLFDWKQPTTKKAAIDEGMELTNTMTSYDQFLCRFYSVYTYTQTIAIESFLWLAKFNTRTLKHNGTRFAHIDVCFAYGAHTFFYFFGLLIPDMCVPVVSLYVCIKSNLVHSYVCSWCWYCWSWFKWSCRRIYGLVRQ